MRLRLLAIPALLLVFVLVFVVAAIFCNSAQASLFDRFGIGPTPTLPPTPTPTPSPTPLPPTPTPTPNPDTPPDVQARAVYLSDMDSGRVLDRVNSDERLPMASTTKIMTALVAIRQGNLDQIVTIGQDAYDRVHADGGSSAELVVGDRLTLRQLLYGMLIPSGADAAVAVADAIAGSPAAFVARMNALAAALHLVHTRFLTVDGLTAPGDQHYTSAADLTTLALYAMRYSLFAQVVQTQAYTIPPTMYHHGYNWQTTNTLFATYPGTLGIKTGYTDDAGWCLVFAVVQGNHRLIGTVLGSPDSGQRDQDVITLLGWGFSFETRHHL